MARPTKPRNIRKLPAATTFKPVQSKAGQATTELGLDEFEAMRLSDVEHLSQEEVAQMMNLSRQSIQLMLQSAREKVTRALLEGHSLVIGGGHIEVYHCPYECLACQHHFFVPATQKTRRCPACGSTKTACRSDDFCATHCRG